MYKNIGKIMMLGFCCSMGAQPYSAPSAGLKKAQKQIEYQELFTRYQNLMHDYQLLQEGQMQLHADYVQQGLHLTQEQQKSHALEEEIEKLKKIIKKLQENVTHSNQ